MFESINASALTYRLARQNVINTYIYTHARARAAHNLCELHTHEVALVRRKY